MMVTILIVCNRRVADPQGESAIFEAAREWVEDKRINIVDIDNTLQTWSPTGLPSASKDTICTYCRINSSNDIFADTFRLQWPELITVN